MSTVDLPYPVKHGPTVCDEKQTQENASEKAQPTIFKDITRDPLFWERAVAP